MLRVAISSSSPTEYVVERLTSRILQTRIHTSVSLGIDYFNTSLATWEPLIEYWEVTANVQMPSVKDRNYKFIEEEEDLVVVSNALTLATLILAALPM